MTGKLRLDSRDVLWLGLTGFVVLAIAFLLPVHPNDYWWYVRLGEDIVSRRAIPLVETWSYTQAGQPVTYAAWLSALIFWGLHSLGNLQATVLARGLFLLGFYAFLWLACRLEGAGYRLASLITLLAALAGSSNWGVRPQLFTYLLFGMAVWALIVWNKGDNRGVWLLPLVTLLWVNLHGSFILIFLLVMAALVGGQGNRRKLALALVLMGFASLVNPRGIGSWGYLLGMLNNPAVRKFSSEWRPPINAGWQAGLFYAWLLMFVPLAALARRKLPLVYWLWFIGFGWLALSGVRNIIWFLGILTVLSAGLIAAQLPERPRLVHRKSLPIVNGLLGLFLLTLPLLMLPGMREKWWPASPPVLSKDTPIAAVAWLAAHPELSGPMWSDLAFSSYLTYALPDRPVWIDTRFEVYPVAQWEHYVAIAGAAADWEKLLDEEGISILVINPVAQPALLKALGGANTWRQQYNDGVAAIFIRARITR